MNPVYLGVDVAGAKNTWMMSLSPSSDGLAVVDGPRKASLVAVVDYCGTNNVVAATIDAQLTAALSEENGFRESDTELRKMLLERQGSINWVASATSLLAVPVRGRLLAEHLSPTVGTVIETHPRASLLFALGEEFLVPIWEYKPKRDDTRSETEVRRSHVRTLLAFSSTNPCTTTARSIRWSARPSRTCTTTKQTRCTGSATRSPERRDAARSTSWPRTRSPTREVLEEPITSWVAAYGVGVSDLLLS